MIIFEQIWSLMNKEIIIDNGYGEGAYIHDYKLTIVTWKETKTIPTEVYRKMFSETLTFSEKTGVVNFVSDSRLGGVVSPEDRKWFQEVAVPWAAKCGLKHAAIIMKKDPFKKYYMNTILKFVNRNASYDIKIFYDYDEALKWLLSFNDYK